MFVFGTVPEGCLTTISCFAYVVDIVTYHL